MEANWPDVLFTEEFQTKIASSRVLLVGAGGIGSEVLKTLVLTGFQDISLIDLDSIEISNLNRQFLFRCYHVGQSKAKVAAEAVQSFLLCDQRDSPVIAPLQKKQKPLEPVRKTSQWDHEIHGQKLQVTPYHANIKDSKFNVDFFKSQEIISYIVGTKTLIGFNIVLNGLDNLDARRHVNRLCFAAEIPLIESGTAGYEGSVTVHIKGRSHCYECEEKPVPTSFPICTIRNTPDKMIHCVVWSKDLLFSRLFGAVDQTTDLDESDMSYNLNDNESPLDYAMRVFKRVFEQDIHNVLKIENLWTERSPPKPIRWSFEYVYPDPLNLSTLDIYKNLSLAENVTLFLSSVCTILDSRVTEIGRLSFDKDDEVAMAFVTSAANLRAICYGIPTVSFFEMKGMAGNIIHAIATTNATVAGMIVTECCKVLSGCFRFLRESFVGKHSAWGLHKRKRDNLIKSMMPPSQNPSCVVCGKSMITVLINTRTTTLESFITRVIKGALSISVPNLSCQEFMYEEGEGLDEDEKEEYEAMLSTILSKLPGGGIQDGALIEVQSQVQHFQCKIIISHQDNIDDEQYPEGFILLGTVKDLVHQESSPLKKISRKRVADELEISSDVVELSEDETELEEDSKATTIITSKKQRLESNSKAK